MTSSALPAAPVSSTPATMSGQPPPLFPEVQEVMDLGLQMVSSLKFWQKKASDLDQELQREREKCSHLSEGLSTAEEQALALGRSIPSIQESLLANLALEKDLETIRASLEVAESALSREGRERKEDSERHKRCLGWMEAERGGDIDVICDWYERERARMEEGHREAEARIREQMQTWADEQAESHAQVRDEYEARVIKLEEELFAARRSSSSSSSNTAARQLQAQRIHDGQRTEGQVAKYEALVKELRSEVSELKKKLESSSLECDDFDNACWGKSSKKKKVTFDLSMGTSDSTAQEKPKKSLLQQKPTVLPPPPKPKSQKMGSMGDVLAFTMPKPMSFLSSGASSGLFGGQRPNSSMSLASSKAGQKRKLFNQSLEPNEKLF